MSEIDICPTMRVLLDELSPTHERQNASSSRFPSFVTWQIECAGGFTGAVTPGRASPSVFIGVLSSNLDSLLFSSGLRFQFQPALFRLSNHRESLIVNGTFIGHTILGDHLTDHKVMSPPCDKYIVIVPRRPSRHTAVRPIFHCSS